ncbi:MAG: hypothetical protein LBD87_06255 [Prevotellaceae bacterium]|jgi:hypothetical protein|nr:hypothetical protein [Prevotellaceae bacterium]
MEKPLPGSTVTAMRHENKRRRALFDAPYNPITGYGDTAGIRASLAFTCEGHDMDWYIPAAMQEEPVVHLLQKYKSMERAAAMAAVSGEELFYELMRARCRYDYEFWAAICAKIQDKETKKIIPFILNRPQRKLLHAIIKMYEAGAPVRIIICKARQWGGSTLVQLFMQWLQAFRYDRWHSVIATHVENQARVIRSMFTRVAKFHPPEIGAITMRNFEGSAKNKLIVESEAVISIGSMQQPDSLRSQDIMMAHLSEVGLWKETEGKKPEDLIQTIVGSIPYIPGTMIVQESTAKGVGNYFHRAWQHAVRAQNNDTPVFVAWHEIKMYQLDIPGNVAEFIRSFTEYEHFLWRSGATLEGIHWYRAKLKEFKGDVWRMQSEFPTTPDEAFQSDARRVFSPLYVKTAEQYVREPLLIGELSAKARTGAGALQDIRFAGQPSGNLKIWIAPPHLSPPAAYCQLPIANRFCGFLDIGGRTYAADWSVLSIIDRLPALKGQPVELAAQWRGHTDQDILAWTAAMICQWYDHALLGIEVNSLKRKGEEADHSFTILDTIAEHYDNLFHRTSVEDIRAGIPKKWGFHTNKASKEMILDNLNAALRDASFIEHAQEAVDEYNCFEEKPDGSKGAVEGAHDDIVLSRAGALWLAQSFMEPPKIVRAQDFRKLRRNMAGEASF